MNEFGKYEMLSVFQVEQKPAAIEQRCSHVWTAVYLRQFGDSPLPPVIS